MASFQYFPKFPICFYLETNLKPLKKNQSNLTLKFFFRTESINVFIYIWISLSIYLSSCLLIRIVTGESLVMF